MDAAAFRRRVPVADGCQSCGDSPVVFREASSGERFSVLANGRHLMEVEQNQWLQFRFMFNLL